MFAKFVEIPCHRKRDIRFESNTVHSRNDKNFFVMFYKPTEEFISTQRTHYWSERFLEVPVIVECIGDKKNLIIILA